MLFNLDDFLPLSGCRRKYLVGGASVPIQLKIKGANRKTFYQNNSFSVKFFLICFATFFVRLQTVNT